MSNATPAAPALGHNTPRLAIDGGEPVRTRPMPPRFALGDAEVAMIHEVVAHYRKAQVDPGYQGTYEKAYTDTFVKFMGGGYADAVATGTASLYIAVAALDLPPASEVIVSPITDPGTLSSIILNNLVPRVADSEPGTFNMGPEQFVARITPKTRAVMLVHSLGRAADVAGVVKEAHARDIRVIEDCSQSHGARVKGRPIGNFGDIAAFSTMYRKAHMTGGAGGVVYSRDIDLHHRALAAGGPRQAIVAARFRRPQSEPVPVPGAQLPHRRDLLRHRRFVAATAAEHAAEAADVPGRADRTPQGPRGHLQALRLLAERRSVCLSDRRRRRSDRLRQGALRQSRSRRGYRAQSALSLSGLRLAMGQTVSAGRLQHAQRPRYARPFVHALPQRKLRQFGSGRYAPRRSSRLKSISAADLLRAPRRHAPDPFSDR